MGYEKRAVFNCKARVEIWTVGADDADERYIRGTKRRESGCRILRGQEGWRFGCELIVVLRPRRKGKADDPAFDWLEAKGKGTDIKWGVGMGKWGISGQMTRCQAFLDTGWLWGLAVGEWPNQCQRISLFSSDSRWASQKTREDRLAQEQKMQKAAA